jgi:PEGA domain
LRLRVEPRHAEVYVDGYFAGHVDDFDGTFQALRLEEGPYRIEIVAPGYETLEFDIRIQPGRKITYRGELRPRP